MAFEEIPSKIGGCERLVGKVTVGIDSRGDLHISVGSDVAATAGLSKGAFVKLLFGTGADYGLVRLVPDPDGLLTLRSISSSTTSGTLHVSTTRLPKAADRRRHKSIGVAYQVEHGAVTITLPAWFYGMSKEAAE